MARLKAGQVEDLGVRARAHWSLEELGPTWS